MSDYRGPDYLGDDDEPRHRVRCPVHGFIRFSPNEQRLLDHPLLQRLGYIRQLALTQLLFPGAVHTRFEHSLGVMEMATRIFDRLAARHGGRMARVMAEVLDERPLARARQLVRLAGLLHDVGHPPFAHTTESVLCPDGGHEALTRWALRETDLGDRVDRLYWTGCAAQVAQLIEGQPALPGALAVLGDIVAGQMDADRADYLLRDSLHCGVEYGRFDVRRLIECLELREDDTGRLQIALARDGLHTFEAMILSRHQMTTQVYHHRVRRIYDRYLAAYCAARRDDLFPTRGRVLAENDITVLARVFADGADPTTSADRHQPARRIATRDHHRRVFSTGKEATDADIGRARALHRELEQRYPDIDWLLDITAGQVHAQPLPGEPDDTPGLRPLYLVGGGDPERPATHESTLLRAIPRGFQTARLFASPRSPTDADWRTELHDAAARSWHTLDGPDA